jgi:hypothetical protein
VFRSLTPTGNTDIMMKKSGLRGAKAIKPSQPICVYKTSKRITQQSRQLRATLEKYVSVGPTGNSHRPAGFYCGNDHPHETSHPVA